METCPPLVGPAVVGFFYLLISQMNKLLLGWIGVVVVIGGILSYLNLQPREHYSPEGTLREYTEFLDKLQDPSLKTKLAASCKDGNTFKQQMKELEDYLKHLQRQKSKIYIPDPDLYIPRIGEQPLDLDGNPIYEGGKDPMPEPDEYIPRIGEQPLDLDGNPIYEGGKDPMPEPDEYIPQPGDQPLDMMEPEPEPIESIINQIATMDQEILSTLNALQSLCDEDKGDCTAACQNYVNKCLTLVPNAGPSLFKQGMDSCLVECKKRDTNKISCIAKSPRCEPMTDTCGL